MKYYINDLYGFLSELAANNDRDWFRANKNRYDDLRALWLADISRMIDAMSVREPALMSLTAKRAAYRIYRDTRFSPDKTPYKTFFSAAMNAPGTQSGFYIQIGPDPHQWAGLFAGIWCPEAPLLKKLRRAIVDNIEEWESIVNSPGIVSNFEITTSDSLKTVPRGWPKDHPHAGWLRMKDYGLQARNVGPEFFLDPAWPERSAELLSLTKPFVDFLNYSAAEE